ncbi:MAG: energy transducer TonB [Bacteroidia bacterium]|nr:energy transducer TonB [Bacteroidia bacterium]
MMKNWLFLFWFILATNFVLSAQKDSLKTNSCFSNPDIFEGQKVYKAVDQYPEYPGGMMEFHKYLRNNMDFSLCDANRSTLHITFVIDTLGNVKNCCTRDTQSEHSCNTKAIEVIQKSRPWKPALLNGQKVCVRINFPIKICFK